MRDERKRYDDITTEVTTVDGERLTVRLFFPALGQKAGNRYGSRRDAAYLTDDPMVQLYVTARVNTPQDPLGWPFLSFSARRILANRLKNGKLRLSAGRPQNGEVKHRSRVLPADQVDKLLDFLADADSSLAGAKAARRERVLARWRARLSLAVRLAPYTLDRPSALAERRAA